LDNQIYGSFEKGGKKMKLEMKTCNLRQIKKKMDKKLSKRKIDFQKKKCTHQKPGAL
jgi:hypothetical protein